MKLAGYERIDSVKNDRETHAFILHRQVPITRSGSAGYKTVSLFVTDRVLEANGLNPADIVQGFADGKEFVFETVRNGDYDELVSVILI